MKNENDIMRFIDAQDSSWSGYDVALGEIRSGRKSSHWIWYIFPQLRGLGHSRNSHYYGIADRQEALDYLNHPVLGCRLREITEALLAHSGRSARSILGGIDALKVRSCMTLFDSIAPNDIFDTVLAAFYDGDRDPKSVF